MTRVGLLSFHMVFTVYTSVTRNTLADITVPGIAFIQIEPHLDITQLTNCSQAQVSYSSARSSGAIVFLALV